jgi:hypothetical protein
MKALAALTILVLLAVVYLATIAGEAVVSLMP